MDECLHVAEAQEADQRYLLALLFQAVDRDEVSDGLKGAK